jgi:G:T/U-mismatch repair DNA glycosylase
MKPEAAPIEQHPLGFFLPEQTKLLMLGSFPPPRSRWSMDFYYPNIQNDMWRILGLVFYNDRDYFLETPKTFSKEKAVAFCREKGIGIGDTAAEVIRLKDNASDNFLEVVKPFDPVAVMQQIPLCQAIAVTGQKAMDTFLSVLPQAEGPQVGSYTRFTLLNRMFKLFRMPSSSRAYPKPLKEKAVLYRAMFEELRIKDTF